MNLINDQWLPVYRRSGTSFRIAPWQLTDDMAQDPVEKFNALRPDFNGALVQFCIGLVQTAFAPKNDREWMALYQTPPEPQVLQEAMQSYQHAFEADGDGPCFMQDFDLPDGEAKGIGALLLEEPGGNALRLNTDHFIKRGNAEAMSPAMAMTALLTLQLNAPAGGVGHRVSIRGGGPLTTLLTPDLQENPEHNTLWHLVWLNVLPREVFERSSGNPAQKDKTAIFPWLGPTRKSRGDRPVAPTDRDTTPEDVHPLQMYWSMPRRIRLEWSETEEGECSLSGESGLLVRRFRTKNYGINYTGPWQHPLSPYRFDPQGMPLPLHAQPDGLSYRHWLSLALGNIAEKDQRAAAAVVHYHTQKSGRRKKIKTKLWTFGYDMDNMKARGWHEAHMPLVHLEPEYREYFIDMVRDILNATGQVADNLRGALKKAWFKPKAKVGGDLSFIVNAFWQNTEADFYALLSDIHAAVVKGGDEISLYHRWFQVIDAASQQLLSTWTASGRIEHEDPKRIALAHLDLRKFNRKKVIQEILRLNMEEAEA
ncbi:type I-E CRISPR-associated protein Cse1/CasA [Candidatus Electrothrix sp.]|uniref:type I-E CRISPR-associated protein Cse1/CasA n=1 Tax=Candidatus Electrothrix sp. TaxID=2170559 RepID=UPI004055AC1C